MRALILLLAFALSQTLHASCDSYKQIEEAGLYESEAFWEDFAKISTKGQPSDSQVSSLIAKHKSNTPAAPAAITPAPSLSANAPRASLVGNRQVQLHRDAVKGLDKAPAQVQQKFDKLVELVRSKGANGAIRELKSQNWKYEYLKSEKIYSVRLNEGYRATFDIQDDVMTIRAIGKDVYAH